MMGPISRQDVQNIVETSRNRIFERVAMRQDLLNLTEVVKNLLTTAQQNQQLLRQAEYQRSQMTRRMVAVEARLAALEQEVKPLRSVVTRMIEQGAAPQKIVLQQQPATGRQTSSVPPEQQYLYKPS